MYNAHTECLPSLAWKQTEKSSNFSEHNFFWLNLFFILFIGQKMALESNNLISLIKKCLTSDIVDYKYMFLSRRCLKELACSFVLVNNLVVA